MKRILVWLMVILFGLLAYFQVSGYRPAFLAPFWPAPAEKSAGSARRTGADGPVAALTSPVRYADVPVTLDAIGTAQPLNTVTIRSQIDGRLLKMNFSEGQDVRTGDVLAEIDPAIAQAQYDQAAAKKAQDEAQLANARMDLERYTRLAATQYTSRQQADTQAATVTQLEAQIRADQASLDTYKALLDYTVIRAPIDGRVGLRAIDPGNIVHASDSNGLVTLTQLRPMAVVFSVPQIHVRSAVQAMQKGPLAASVLDGNSPAALDHGFVRVIDTQVDQTTGTVKFKAEFPNQDLQLWPGQFVNVRLEINMLRHVLTVPAIAVQRGPDGAFLYRVKEGSAELVMVSVVRQDEQIAVISGGVAEGDIIVTSGFARLKEGAKVAVQEAGPAAHDVGSAPEPVKAGGKKSRKDASSPAGSGPDVKPAP